MDGIHAEINDIDSREKVGQREFIFGPLTPDKTCDKKREIDIKLQ